MIPGEVFPAPGEIELNAGRPVTLLEVANTGDRPIQVGSHYHFSETNPALRFDRAAARGQRLNIAAGTATRFEPERLRICVTRRNTDPSRPVSRSAAARHNPARSASETATGPAASILNIAGKEGSYLKALAI